MSTRRTAEGLAFDHGTQYFTARTPAFRGAVEAMIESGAVAVWGGRIGSVANGVAKEKQDGSLRYVGVPGMNVVCTELARGLQLRFRTLAAAPIKQGTSWALRDADGEPLGVFDWVVVATPAPQAVALLAPVLDLSKLAGSVTMTGCWATIASFPVRLPLPLDGAFVSDSPLSWVCRNNSKPGRPVAEVWVLHATPQWTGVNLDRLPEDVLPEMLNAFWRATGMAPQQPLFATSHRWRYALPPEPLVMQCLFDAREHIGACGDWCGGPRVEGAYLSGAAMAKRVLQSLSEPAPTAGDSLH
jgi:predicted NAD/FAD-dependent oxidoreductase